MTTSCDADMKATATASSAKACVAPVGEVPASSNSAPRQHQLRQHQPAAPPAEPRQVEAVHQRRPQELEGVGQADQAEEADGRHVEPFDASARPASPARSAPAAAPMRSRAPLTTTKRCNAASALRSRGRGAAAARRHRRDSRQAGAGAPRPPPARQRRLSVAAALAPRHAAADAACRSLRQRQQPLLAAARRPARSRRRPRPSRTRPARPAARSGRRRRCRGVGLAQVDGDALAAARPGTSAARSCRAPSGSRRPPTSSKPSRAGRTA